MIERPTKLGVSKTTVRRQLMIVMFLCAATAGCNPFRAACQRDTPEAYYAFLGLPTPHAVVEKDAATRRIAEIFAARVRRLEVWVDAEHPVAGEGLAQVLVKELAKKGYEGTVVRRVARAEEYVEPKRSWFHPDAPIWRPPYSFGNGGFTWIGAPPCRLPLVCERRKDGFDAVLILRVGPCDIKTSVNGKKTRAKSLKFGYAAFDTKDGSLLLQGQREELKCPTFSHHPKYALSMWDPGKLSKESVFSADENLDELFSRSTGWRVVRRGWITVGDDLLLNDYFRFESEDAFCRRALGPLCDSLVAATAQAQHAERRVASQPVE